MESAEALCPPRHLPGRAHPPAGRARRGSRAAAARRASTRGSARSARASGPTSTSSTRCCRTSRGSTCRRGARAARRARTRSRASTSRVGLRTTPTSRSTTTRATCSRSASWTGSSACCCAACARTGLLDEALLVVIADHGYAFEMGVHRPAHRDRANVDEVAPVPLFVKAPGQSEGEVDESLVRNIDIVPTIADLLGTEPRLAPRRPLASSRPRRRRRDEVVITTRDFKNDGPDRRGRSSPSGAPANRARWAHLFGTGARERAAVRRPVGERLPRGPEPGAARTRRAGWPRQIGRARSHAARTRTAAQRARADRQRGAAATTCARRRRSARRA